jgi:DNA-binding Lrp family transcriptional regulator
MMGTDSTNNKIINALKGKKLSVTDIAKASNLVRTTVQYRVKGLLEEKVISRSHIVGRRILYVLNKIAVNEARVSRLFEVFTGPNIQHAYRYFFDAPKNTTVYSVQGVEAVNRIINILPKDFLEEAHQKQKRRNIIIKGFSNRRVLPMLKEQNVQKLKSHIGRAVGLKFIDEDLLLGPCEILCIKSAFLIVDTKKKKALVFRDKTVTSFFYEILSIFYNNFEKVEVFRLNDFFGEIAKNKQFPNL